MRNPRSALARSVGRGLVGLPREYWWLWSGTLVTRLGYFVQPFLVLYLTSARSLSAPRAALVVSAFGAGSLVSQPLGGLLADRLGRRRALTAGLTASAVTLLALGAARTTPLMLAAATLAGASLDLYRPASQALVADLVAPQVRPRAYALLYWAVNLGYAVATAAAGFLASVGFGWLFILDAATSLVFAILVGRGIRRVPSYVGNDHLGDPRDERPYRPHDRDGLLTVLGDRLLLGFAAITLLYAVVYLQVASTLPLAVRASGLPTSAFGLVISLNGLLIVAVQPFTVHLLDRIDRVKVLAAGQLILGVGFALTGLCHSLWQFAGSVTVWTIGEIATAGTATAVVADLAPSHLRGRYLGVAGGAWGLAALLAPLVGISTFTVAPGALWLSCLGAGCACAIAQLAINRRLIARRSTAASPSPVKRA